MCTRFLCEAFSHIVIIARKYKDDFNYGFFKNEVTKFDRVQNGRSRGTAKEGEISRNCLNEVGAVRECDEEVGGRAVGIGEGRERPRR